MRFNLDPNKQTEETFRKKTSKNFQSLSFKGSNVETCSSQNIWDLSSTVNFDVHVQNKISKCNKVIGIVKWLSIILSLDVVLTVRKMFIRPHVDYADIMHEKTNNELFCKKMKAFNIKPVLLLQDQFKEHLKINFLENLGKNL